MNKPNVARVWDFWLGGKTNFAADRELAAAIEHLNPQARQTVLQSRDFLSRAVTWAAEQGIGQFIDIGSGLPVIETRYVDDVRVEAVHVSARAIVPDASVVYIDNDAIVHAHASALLPKDPGLAALFADLRDPAAVLASKQLLAVIDLDEPCCLILAMILHFLTAAEASQVITQYMSRMAPGSCVIISVIGLEEELNAQVSPLVSAAADMHHHTRQEIVSFFEGLQIIEPGVVRAEAWRGHESGVRLQIVGSAYVLAGVGCKLSASTSLR